MTDLLKERRYAFELALAEFRFLEHQDFKLKDRSCSTGLSFKDGFHIRFASPRLSILIDYTDMQLDIDFDEGEMLVSYFEADRVLFDSASGYGGNMFPVDKLPNAISKIAHDIAKNYGTLLRANKETFRAILNATPPYKGLP